MELVLVRQRMFVDGIECTVTELISTYPLLTKFHGPFARIIVLPGQSANSETSRTPATAPGSCGLQMMTGNGGAGGNGNASRRG